MTNIDRSRARVDPVMAALTDWRILLGVQQQEIAERIGVHKATISEWENGRGPVRMDAVRRYAAGLGLRVEFNIKALPDGDDDDGDVEPVVWYPQADAPQIGTLPS